MKKGLFITFEGAEGSGKSTQIELIHQDLLKQNKPVVLIREPGGVPVSEQIRSVLLNVENTDMADECEMLLYMAARSQLVRETILPALEQEKIVLSDRYLDSTLVYQGYGHNMDLEMIRRVGSFATLGLTPDLTFLFDIDPQEGLSRTGRNQDRIEQRSLEYHQKVRQGYLELARQEPDRIVLIKVDRSKEEIHQQVKKRLESLFAERPFVSS